tara:strand:+ start:31 stop:1971 length:1941 start_codon:yes stop_codon:yes gene_type:complete
MHKLLIILLLLILVIYYFPNRETFVSKEIFDGQTILITGGTRGLGFAIAKYFTRYDCKLLITGIQKNKLQYAVNVLRKKNKNVEGYILDLSDKKSINEFAKLIDKKKIDILINCAYKKSKRKELTSSNPGDIMSDINVNISGTLYLNQKILKNMRYYRTGKIFFISSPSSKAHDTLVYKSSDIISKHAVEKLTDLLAYENYKYKIGVCTIRVDTGIFSDTQIDTSKTKNKTLKKIYNKTNSIVSLFSTSPDDIIKYITPILKMPYHQINGKLYTTRMFDNNDNEALTKYVPQSQILLQKKLYSQTKFSKNPGKNDIYVNKQNPYAMSKSMENTLKKYNFSKQNKNLKTKNSHSLAKHITSKLKLEKEQIVFFKNEHECIKSVMKILVPKYNNVVTVFPLSERFHYITSDMKIDVKFTVFDAYDKTIQPKYKHIHNLMTPKTKVVYFSNPNVLTGQTLIKKDFEKYLNKIPDNIITIIDETYLDLVTDKTDFNSLKYLNENVLVIRSFSNLCAYEDLEVTYVLGAEKFIEIINDNNSRFNQISKLNQDLAITCFDDHKYKQKIHKKLIKEKKRIYKKLESNDINYFPSNANYILIEPNKTQEQIIKDCENNNIIVEHENAYYDNYWSLPLGESETNDRMIDLLASKF